MPGAFAGWNPHQGLATAGSVTLAVGLGAYFHQQDLWWAAISAWIVSNPDFAALLRKTAMRLAGTAFGLLIGFFLAVAIENDKALQLIAIFAISAFGSYQRFASNYGYAWFYGAVTMSLLLAVSIVQPASLFAFAEFRFPEIAIGCLASAFVHALLGPARAGAPAKAVVGEPTLNLSRLALVGGFSGVAVVLFWTTFDLPSLPQGLISALVLLDRDLSNIRVRARQRFLGCLLGAALGLGFLCFNLDAAPIYFTVLFAGMFFFSRIHHGGGAQSYIGTQGGLAFITAMVTGRGPPTALEPVLDRLAGIFVGVALMTTVAFALDSLIAPRGQPRRESSDAAVGREDDGQAPILAK